RERRDRVRELVALRRVDDVHLVGGGDALNGPGRSRDPAQTRGRVGAGGVLHRHELQVVLERERDVDVADRSGRVRDDAGDAGAALATLTGRPVRVDADADLRLPAAADGRQVVREVVGRAAVVAPVDRRDVGRGQGCLRVQRLDRGVVPLLDLPEIDL